MRRLAVAGALCLLVLMAGCAGFAVELDAQPQDDSDPPRGPADCEPGYGSANATESDSTDDGSSPGTLSVHYLDVGQADATFVRGPENETMLIDTGHWNDDGETVIEYLEARDVGRIDYLVSTHAHADHVGGSAAVIEHFETEGDGVGSVWDSGVPHTSATYEEYLDAIDEHDVTLYETQACDRIPMAGATVDVLNPPADHGDDDLDANSVVVRIGYGDAGFLFTGDMTSATEPELVDRWGDDLQSTVYQAGHHGSSTSSSAAFLDAVDPRVAVVSSAHDSEYGHPHEEPLERFADRGIDTYWTGTHGTIVAGTDGESVTVRTVADATTDPRELASAPPADASATAPIEVRDTYVANATGSTDALVAPSPTDAPVAPDPIGATKAPAAGGTEP